MKKLVLVLSLLPLAAIANPPHGNPDCGDNPPMHHRHDGHGGGHLPRFLKKLDLSDKQEAEIKNLLKTRFGDGREQIGASRDAREALHALSFSADYNEDKAKDLLEKAAAAHRQMALEKAKLDHEIFMLLTTEQQQKLTAELANFAH